MKENLLNLIVLTDVEKNLDIIKTSILFILTYFTNFKIINKKFEFNVKNIIKIGVIVLISIVCGIIRYEINTFFSIISLIIILGIIFSKEEIGNSIVITVISLSINYIINLFAIILYYIPNLIFSIENDYISILIITLLRLILLTFTLNMKKLKYGFSFLKNNLQNMYLDLLIFNLSGIILFSVSIFESSLTIKDDQIGLVIIILSLISIVSIQKSFQIYYQQKLLINELGQTKHELKIKEQEIENLEQENLNFSKKSHSLAHKQKSLEYKLNQLMLKNEISDEIDLKDRLESISKELYENTAVVELTKTDIPEIDDMLQFMQAECKTNNIDFNLQISGNLYYMINNLITKEELEILIADHIKDAIIAIKHTNNVNKSILVRLGKIDECYGLYIYDSGIEFEKETLENLGKKPSTTHADEGGTGMGFMNTFDTLRKYKASLIIHEIGAPSKDNYTKVLMIKFDNKNEFKVISYKEKI